MNGWWLGAKNHCEPKKISKLAICLLESQTASGHGLMLGKLITYFIISVVGRTTKSESPPGVLVCRVDFMYVDPLWRVSTISNSPHPVFQQEHEWYWAVRGIFAFSNQIAGISFCALLLTSGGIENSIRNSLSTPSNPSIEFVIIPQFKEAESLTVCYRTRPNKSAVTVNARLVGHNSKLGFRRNKYVLKNLWRRGTIGSFTINIRKRTSKFTFR